MSGAEHVMNPNATLDHPPCQERTRGFAWLWLATLLVSALALRAVDSTNLAVHATDDPHPSGEGPSRLEQSTRVVLNTNAPAVTAAETNAPARRSRLPGELPGKAGTVCSLRPCSARP